mgnify:CR=1 FL=1
MPVHASHTTRALVAGLLVAATAAGLGAGRGEREERPPRQLFPDMDDQPRFKA